MPADRTAYPVILTNLNQVRCVVVGGGAVAERKVRDLLAAGARPCVISPALTEMLAAWRDSGDLEHIPRCYEDGDLAGAFLAIAATGKREVNAAVAEEGARRGMLVNIADDPASGNFHTVAAVRRGDLLLTVSTGGRSPALSALIRRDLELHYGPAYGTLLDNLSRLREGPARRLKPQQRAMLWRRLICEEVVGWLRDGALEKIARHADEQLSAVQEETTRAPQSTTALNTRT